ncbi:putative Serpin family protein [Helianthus annuus]|nr:putative Serpin family protein [Helianthus annuus]
MFSDSQKDSGLVTNSVFGSMGATWIPSMQALFSFLILSISLLLVTTRYSSVFNIPPVDFISKADGHSFQPQHLNESLQPPITNFQPPHVDESPQPSISNKTRASMALATHLLTQKQNDSNVVLSPLSIHVLLSMVAVAYDYDHRRDRLLTFLETKSTYELSMLQRKFLSSIVADGSPNSGPQLSFENAVWIDKNLLHSCSFKSVVTGGSYGAAYNRVDYNRTKAVEVDNEVNLWAEKKTSGYIKEVILANDATSTFRRLIFANVVYFKGEWSQKFDPTKTKESDFHLIDGNKVQIPFMTSKEDQFVTEYDDFKVVGLPYSQGQDKRQFTMYIFLPDAKDGLQSLLQKIDYTPEFFERHIPHEMVEVGQFLIPKFNISFGFEVSDMLKEFGLVLPFNSTDGPISIHQKSFVEVNEEGIEAAPATLMMDSSARMARDKVDFVANHPFLFVIREDVSGVVLFMGKVIDPSVVE